jgi:VanZ family protein
MAELHVRNAPRQKQGAHPASGRVAQVVRVVWPLAIAGLIFLASAQSKVVSPNVTSIDDKIVHFGIYGLLATLTCRLGSSWAAAGWTLLAISAYGMSDEWHQSFVPGRSTSIADWIADTLGALTAVTLYRGWGAYRRLLEWPMWRRKSERQS